MTYLIKAPRSTAHKTATPSLLPAKAAAARSPAPTPVAAMRMPGMMTARDKGRVGRGMYVGGMNLRKESVYYTTNKAFRDMKYPLSHLSARQACKLFLVTSLALVCHVFPAMAQQVNGDERWSAEFGEDIEFNAELKTVISSGDQIYAVGTFTRAGGQFAEGMAWWDGQIWELIAAVCMLIIAENKTGKNLYIC